MARATYSRSAIAQLLGVTPQRVTQWIQAGCPTTGDGKKLDLVTVVEWRIARAETQARSATRAESPLQRKLDAEAKLKELQLEREQALSVSAEDHEEVVARIAGGFAAVAAGQLQRFERRMVQARTPADARVITQDIHRALMEGAQELAESLDSDADELEPEEKASA